MVRLENLDPVVTVTEPTAYISRLKMVPYNAPVGVVPVCNAQLCGLFSTMMHGAEVPPRIPKSLTSTAAGTNIQQNICEYWSH